MVVVIGEGAGVEVCCVVVVVDECEPSSVPQPVSENKAVAATQERMMVFIIMLMGGLLI